ncbi:MAG: apolipoprotein N-acyltransferase, partial [Woeseiaceae bacterium]
MMTIAFAPLRFYGIAPLVLFPVLVACLHARPREAARLAFWFGAGLFLFGTYWLYTSIHVFGQAPLWIAIL